MAELFGRDIIVNIDGTRIASRLTSGEITPLLKMMFKVSRSLKKDPNSLELTIHNLSRANRIKFQRKHIPVILEAGYIDNTSVLFAGDVEFSSNVLSGQDWITTIESGDSSKKFSGARVSASLRGPVQITDAVNLAADALGIDLGNLSEKLQAGSLRGALDELSGGVALSGKAEKQFDKLIRSMGYGWSVQNGKMQVLGPQEFIEGGTVVLSGSSGMIGTPEPGEKGFMNVKALIRPSLVPGRRIELQTRAVNGFYRVEKTETIGDTWGGSASWYVDMEMKPLT